MKANAAARKLEFQGLTRKNGVDIVILCGNVYNLRRCLEMLSFSGGLMFDLKHYLVSTLRSQFFENLRQAIDKHVY